MWGLERQPVFNVDGRDLSFLGVPRAFQDTALRVGCGKGHGMRMPVIPAGAEGGRVVLRDDLTLQRYLLDLMGDITV